MKKQILKTTFVLALLLMNLSGLAKVFADATEDSTPVSVGAVGSETVPVDDGFGETPGTTAPFQIYRYPKELSFGITPHNFFEQRVELVSYDQGGINGKSVLPLVVSDQRATYSGWHVNASVRDGKFFSNEDPTHFIKNPQLEFSGTPVSLNIQQNSDDSFEVIWNEETYDVNVPVLHNIGAQDSTVISSGENKGVGYQGAWLHDVKLVIPSSQGKTGNTYTGIIDWKLIDEPE